MTYARRVGEMKSSKMETNEWWAELPAAEKELIRAVMRLLKGARQSRIREVAQAASEWERISSLTHELASATGSRGRTDADSVTVFAPMLFSDAERLAL